MIPKILGRNPKPVKLDNGDLAVETHLFYSTKEDQAETDQQIAELVKWTENNGLTTENVFIGTYYESTPVGEYNVTAIIFRGDKAQILLHLLT